MMATESLGQCISDDDLHSPTDASDDSVEVKVHPILALSKKNKRKLGEPRKVDAKVSPAKRARKTHQTSLLHHHHHHHNQIVPNSAPSPFRPWSEPPLSQHGDDQPLSLVVRPSVVPTTPSPALCGAKPTVAPPPIRKRIVNSKFSVESLIGEQQPQIPKPPALQTPTKSTPKSPRRTPNVETGRESVASSSGMQRNYKNMTRERRIEANARERTRVHTISAAFDTLRQTIPSYSNSQKLSKLSILRIACSYIVALSRVAGDDYSAGQTAPSVPECVDKVTKTIHAEGKVRKKKDD
jgi:atonal protein 8